MKKFKSSTDIVHSCVNYFH